MIEREKEVKVFNLDLDALKEELLSKGAEHLGEEKQVNYILKCDIDAKTNLLKSLLRLREVNKDDKKTFYLTYKIRGKDSGVLRNSKELTSEVKDKDAILEIFEMLGIIPEKVDYKERDSYLYKDARFDFDEYDKETFDRPYLEIEVKNDEKLEELIKEFNIERKNITTKNINELRKNKDEIY